MVFRRIRKNTKKLGKTLLEIRKNTCEKLELWKNTLKIRKNTSEEPLFRFTITFTITFVEKLLKIQKKYSEKVGKILRKIGKNTQNSEKYSENPKKY